MKKKREEKQTRYGNMFTKTFKMHMLAKPNHANHLFIDIIFFICQVTVEYKYVKGAAIPLRVHTVVISIQHDEDITMDRLRKELMEKVIKVVIPDKYLDSKTVFHLQPSGKFIIGGPQVC